MGWQPRNYCLLQGAREEERKGTPILPPLTSDTDRLAATRALGTHRVGGLLRHLIRGLPVPLSQAKIALKGTSEDQLLELEAIAKSLNLCARLIRDGWVVCSQKTVC